MTGPARSVLVGGGLAAATNAQGPPLWGCPMAGPARTVLAGGGLAAAKAAQALRRRGYDGPLTLLTAEPHRPDERPPLSKGYLSGDTQAEEVFVHEAGWYAEH